MEFNEVFLAAIIIALVVLLLSVIYKFGMSRKSFEEILEEQKQYEIALLGKPKPEKKKEKKKQPVSVPKKKAAEKTETNLEKVHPEDVLVIEKTKEVKSGQVATSASKVTKRIVAKEHQADNKVEELTAVEKTDKIKAEKNLPSKIKSEKVEHVTFGAATTKKLPTSSVTGGKEKEHGIMKSVAPAIVESVPPRQSSKSPVAQKPTRSTDAGPVNADAATKKKKNNKEAETNSGESEKIVAGAAPITKAAPSAGSHADSPSAVRGHDAKKSKGSEAKLEANNVQKSSAVPQETSTTAKLTSTGPPPASTEWSTKSQKGDPSVALRRSLEEKDGELRMLQAQLQAANHKYNESRQELVDNNHKFAAHEKALKQQLSSKEQECAELRKRVGSGPGGATSNEGQVQVIMHLSEENRQLKETIVKLQQQVGQQQQAPASQQQQQGGADLKQQLKFMDEALKQNSKLLNTSENSRRTLEAKLKQTEDELNKSSQRVKDLEKKYRDAEAKAEGAKKSSVNEGEVQAYQAKLKEKELQTTELETQMKHFEIKFAQLQQRLQDQDNEIISLRAKNGQTVNFSGQGNGFLENGLNNEYSELAERLDAANKTVQQLELGNNEKAEELKKVLEELNVLRMSRDKDFSLQLERFSEVSNELDRTKEDLVRLEADNKEKCKELQSLTDQLSLYSSSQNDGLENERQLVESQEEVRRTKAELSRLQEELNDRAKELETLSQQSNKQASDEDALEKERQLIESQEEVHRTKAELSRLREELSDRTKELETLSQQSNRQASDEVQRVAELAKEVQKYQEDIEKLKKLNDAKAADIKNVLDELNDVKESNKELSERLRRLSDESKQKPTNGVEANGLEDDLTEAKESDSKLQTEIQHYQTVLHDTERILRQLQDNVEQEEQNWQVKLSASQNQLLEYAERVRELEQRLEESQAEKMHLRHQLSQGFVNGTSSPSIDHKEEKIRKSDRAVVYPAELQAMS